MVDFLIHNTNLTYSYDGYICLLLFPKKLLLTKSASCLFPTLYVKYQSWKDHFIEYLVLQIKEKDKETLRFVYFANKEKR